MDMSFLDVSVMNPRPNGGHALTLPTPSAGQTTRRQQIGLLSRLLCPLIILSVVHALFGVSAFVIMVILLDGKPCEHLKIYLSLGSVVGLCSVCVYILLMRHLVEGSRSADAKVFHSHTVSGLVWALCGFMVSAVVIVSLLITGTVFVSQGVCADETPSILSALEVYVWTGWLVVACMLCTVPWALWFSCVSGLHWKRQLVLRVRLATNTGVHTRVQHQDDIDPDLMSYEELLELGDRIGHVQLGLSQEAIQAMKTFTLKDKVSDMCLCCQYNYNQGDTLRKLPCGHTYHRDCIDQWLVRKPVCPRCRYYITENSSFNPPPVSLSTG